MSSPLSTIITLLPLLLLLPVCNSVPLQYMSFWEYDPYDFAGWCNFAVSGNTTQIRIGYEVNITHLYDMRWLFFEGSDQLCNTSYGTVLNPLVLKSNYASVWDQYYPVIHELFYVNKSIFGFFMGDELVWNGLSPQSLDIASEFIRKNISEAIIYTNAAVPPLQSDVDSCGHVMNYARISSFLDWFSVDLYHHNGTATEFVDTAVKPFYETYVFPKMDLSKQFALCVPGSFSSTYNADCDQQCYDAMCKTDAWNFYDWANTDERIIGLYPWHWEDVNGASVYNIGTKNMNATKTAWNQIGHLILGKKS